MISDSESPDGEIGDKLAAALSRIEIPPRPAILDAILAEMQCEEPSYDRLASLIVSDVGIAAGIVKTANSPLFGYRGKVSTVREALTVLGLLMVARTIAALALRRALPLGKNLEGFWDTSSRVAIVSAWLVRRLGTRDGVRIHDAHTYGLFRDCGIPVLMNTYANYAEALAAAAREPERSFIAVEEDFNLLNHALVGSTMARGWLLPEIDYIAIAHHHDAALLADPASLAAASRRLIAIAQLADWLQQDPDAPTDQEWSKLGPTCLAVLDVAPEALAEMRDEAQALLDASV